ncbi:MAG: hypothetical protein IKX08_01480 [Lachnospiraceae bacterium]|nr:hypothetical protein [Lachnospiraceae bacterium]
MHDIKNQTIGVLTTISIIPIIRNTTAIFFRLSKADNINPAIKNPKPVNNIIIAGIKRIMKTIYANAKPNFCPLYNTNSLKA